ncbi:TonB-dependent receptor [Xanthocytophaga flava]|uniref:TonB-dependent receptor n=1 Tax=Xanthocytophaga flava TaxID=3048013 RepID=UPI0028D8B1C5|nr:TonB-dependent receptor [Xanthocytophaga flavus]MDJ1470092.1 TonB-dependent receptor [Xanthocytophaga flavus]
MKTFFTLCFFLMSTSWIWAQTSISGKVTDAKKEALAGASVYLKGTYDGATTDGEGNFKLITDEKDTATLVVSFIGYENSEQKLQLGKSITLTIVLAESKNATLNEVVITAGVFEASDEKRTTILKPLDIVTTAGAGADIFRALQSLPGTSQVGEQEGLFVRGGSGTETKAVIDGLIVQNPFFSSVPNVAQRGRFSPFQFKGTAFSTGGYSAQYGQALSSVLVLNSNDLPEKSQINGGINFASVYGGYTQRWEKTSLDFNGSYFNVGPILFNLNSQNIEWHKAPQGYSFASNFRKQTSATGMLKVYANLAGNTLGLTASDETTDSGKSTFGLKNQNFYSNVSYTEAFDKGKLYIGFSQSFNKDDLRLDTADASRGDSRTQGRIMFTRDFTNDVAVSVGTELHTYEYKNQFDEYKTSFRDVYWANFLETDVHITHKLVGRAGIRNEYSQVIHRWNVAPRLSLAYKTSDYSQISLAYGQFYQNPNQLYLYINKKLDFEKAEHFILNYQRIRNDRTFRVEAYYKSYSQLVREFMDEPFDANAYRFPYGRTDNSGGGYAQGFDVFFRDRKTFKNSEYWISYSYLDTKRLFANYLAKVMPSFASTHNFSVLYKRYFSKINLQANASYTYSSGRPYYNPNEQEFMSAHTPAYHNLSMSFNYLTSIGGNFTVIYAEVSNVLGTQNVFGYRYSADGKNRIPTSPPTYRSVFLGVNITIDKLKKSKS